MALAFMSPETFNQAEPCSWPLFTTVETARSKFSAGAAVMIAIGGWGDTEGFSHAAATVTSRNRFARNVKTMLEDTGADGRFMRTFPTFVLLNHLGVDIDWEYPGLVTMDIRDSSNYYSDLPTADWLTSVTAEMERTTK